VATRGDDRILLTEQRQLVEQLTDLAGGHQPLPQLPAADESPWTDAILGDRRANLSAGIETLQRRLDHTAAERDWFATELEIARGDLAGAHHYLANLQASSSWRITAPVRSFASVLMRSFRRPAKG